MAINYVRCSVPVVGYCQHNMQHNVVDRHQPTSAVACIFLAQSSPPTTTICERIIPYHINSYHTNDCMLTPTPTAFASNVVVAAPRGGSLTGPRSAHVCEHTHVHARNAHVIHARTNDGDVDAGWHSHLPTQYA